MTKIDVTGYFGTWPYWPLRHGSPEEILRLMDRYEIEWLVLGSLRAIFSEWEEGNDEVRRQARRHPDRFRVAVTINPLLGRDHLVRAEEYRQDELVVGLRLYPIYHDYEVANGGDVLDSLLTYAAETSWPVFLPVRLMMNWGLPVLPVAQVAGMLARFPRLTVILGGINYGEVKHVLPLVRTYARVFLETSCLQLQGALERIAAEIGVDRLLFGTGMPLQNPGCEVARIAHAAFSETERAHIFAENARRLFAREG
jgi:predicted TIM-barrel fold metal-dependent hydrolase